MSPPSPDASGEPDAMSHRTFRTPSGHSVSYRLDGPDGAPLLVLSGSLGTTADLWEPQMEALTTWFRVLRVEHPGHGGSEASDGLYTVEMFGRRVLDLVASLQVARFSFCGMSMGGLVGMWLSAHTELVDRLALCCTRPCFGPPEQWLQRAAEVRESGTGPLVDATLRRWFTARYLARQPQATLRYAEMLEGTDPTGYASCCELLASTDLRADLQLIQSPTLVVAGSEDPVVPPESAASTMSAIPGSALLVIPGAAHLANVEQDEEFREAVVSHLAGSAGRRGLATRRATLGEAHVEGSRQKASALSSGFQDFLDRWPWGEVWSRPGLDRETRRLVTIAMLVALGRPEELALHIRSALTDGVSQQTVRELLLHTAVYAGVPAANSAFSVAERVLAQLTEQPSAKLTEQPSAKRTEEPSESRPGD